MKTPLHLDPDDVSAEAAVKRLALWEAMMRANPRGFRIPSRKKGEPPNDLEYRLNTLRVLA